MPIHLRRRLMEPLNILGFFGRLDDSSTLGTSQVGGSDLNG